MIITSRHRQSARATPPIRGRLLSTAGYLHPSAVANRQRPGRFPAEFRPGDQGRVGTRFSRNRQSDFDELPSGLSLRVEDSRVAIANRQSPMSHNVPKCPLRRGTWDMGHGTGDMGHWPSGSAAMFNQMSPPASGERHAHACVRKRARCGAVWHGLARFGAVFWLRPHAPRSRESGGRQ
jgi:hypothetical protein